MAGTDFELLNVPSDILKRLADDIDNATTSVLMEFYIWNEGGDADLVVEALIRAVDKIIDKAKKIAAHVLEASAEDIEFKDGNFTVAGTDRSMAFGEVALTAYVPHNFPHDTLEPGLDETAFYDPANFTFPGGTHIAEVEIDPDTGGVRLCRYAGVDDVGTIVNPMIVEGQMHGGTAQGVGQALWEEVVYDRDSGQLVSGSFMDYAMPRATDMPFFDVGHNEVPTATNLMGAKGGGEGGTTAAPAAVVNAIMDALAPFGVVHLQMPVTAEKIWRAIRDGA